MRVIAVAGHPVILGVVRLACGGRDDVKLVGEASSGEAAVVLAGSSSVDVVVLDAELPDADGLETLQRLRDSGFTGAVLVLSDRTDGASVLRAMRSGANGYLIKADGLRQVGSSIRRVATGERVVAPALEEAALSELGRFARQARLNSRLGASLTVRERQILGLLAEGLTMHQIGTRLSISPRTVESHASTVYRKLGVRSRVQAVSRAASIGLIELR